MELHAQCKVNEKKCCSSHSRTSQGHTLFRSFTGSKIVCVIGYFQFFVVFRLFQSTKATFLASIATGKVTEKCN